MAVLLIQNCNYYQRACAGEHSIFFDYAFKTQHTVYFQWCLRNAEQCTSTLLLDVNNWHMSSSTHMQCTFLIACFAGAMAVPFGPGLGPIALENVSCSGSEQSLLQCPSDMTEGGSSQCTEHAGTVCERKWTLETTLVYV